MARFFPPHPRHCSKHATLPNAGPGGSLRTLAYGSPSIPRLVVSLMLMLMASAGMQAQIPFIQPPPFDAERVALDDQLRAKAGDLPLYARYLPLMASSDEAGYWSEQDGERIWRLGIASPGALAMEFLLDRVQVPPGACMRFVSADGTDLARAYPVHLPGGIAETSTPLVHADSCILEYREPIDGALRGRFRVAWVGHAYRDVGRSTDDLSCYVNTACLPEAEGWEEAIRSTVRISVVVAQGSGWCSGTLVNNVREDCEPYILSAYHCGRTSTTAHFNQYKFYFNFEYANCGGGSYNTSQFVNGAQLKAYSDDYAPQYQGLGGSDFMLMRLHQDIPDTFNPFWAGWDATNLMTITGGGVSIHHPTGSPKRISTFTQNATTGHPMASSGLMTHYKVRWASTTHGRGVTENGSSGGGMFRQLTEYGPVLVGTLTGSSAGMTCANSSGTSYFGKIAYHWTNNPNTSDLKLKAWLDPDNTGILRIKGSAAPCGSNTGVEGVAGKPALHVFPTPTQGLINVETDAQGHTAFQLTDAVGRMIRTGFLIGPHTVLDLADLPNGGYFLYILDQRSGRHSTPLIIAR